MKKLIFVVFGSMGMLSALSGILFASRLQSATTTAGQLFELDAIAAAYVGGVGESDRFTHRCSGDALPHQRHEPDGHRYLTAIHRPWCCAVLAVVFDVATRTSSK